MLFFQGQRETVDDAAQDLEQLGDAVVPLRLVDKVEKDIIYGAPDEGA